MKPKKNIGASIRQRLLNLSRAEKTAFNQVLDRYIRERFLARLAISDVRERLILKGATLFFAWEETSYRATYDLDLLAIPDGKSAHYEIEQMILTVAETPLSGDGVRYDSSSMRSEAIREQNQYGGVRIRLPAELDTIRLSMHIDIGIGDAVVPPATRIDFPSLLTEETIPLLAYQPETVIVEKYQTIVDLGMVNSRMKDYYDIWFLSKTVEINGQTLATAIRTIFDRRQTEVPRTTAPGLSDEFAINEQKVRQWSTFLERTEVAEAKTLREVIQGVRNLLLTPSIAVATGQEFTLRWSPVQGWQEV